MIPTTEEIAEGLQEILRGNDGVTPAVADVRLLASGYETNIFAFSLAPVNDAGELPRHCVLRLYSGENTAEKAAREFEVMRRLHAVGYPVPMVHTVGISDSPFGSPFLIMEQIMGVSMGATYWSAAGQERAELEALHMQFMQRLHRLEPGVILPESPLAQQSAPDAGLTSELSALAELRMRLEAQEPPSLQAIFAWLNSRRASVASDRVAVIHGDFHPNNILLGADGAASVIDWSNVRVSDYRMDLAWSRLITRADDQHEHGAQELRLYERFAGRPVRDLAYFEVMACMRLVISTLISLRYGAARQGLRPEASALMQEGREHLRYVLALLQERTAIRTPDLEAALLETTLSS
jgi:aminoglycoside phosphotransferase (APT) family kinase protein